ncbi:hypothetical protein N9L68_01500 [bacterium]|nr:hypothetical protein [bacterium]
MLEEDDHLYTCIGKTRGLLCVSPELECFVAAELSKETATMKETRKAREDNVGFASTAKAMPKDYGGNP